MSGGVSEVHAEKIHLYNSTTGIRIKTSPGRGGYVRNIFVSNMSLANVDVAIRFTSHYGEHPDESYDPNALPVIQKITLKDVIGYNITHAGQLEGLQGDNFVDICLSNITLNIVTSAVENPWNCSYIQGYSDSVSPDICQPLEERIYPDHYSDCYHLSNHFWCSRKQNRGARLLSW